MACPHVAGAAALLLQDDPNLSAAGISKKLRDASTKDAISNVGGGSPNMLVYIPPDSTVPTMAPTTTTTNNQFGRHAWFVSQGSCSIDAGGCALSPNYPSSYNPEESCSIVVKEMTPGPIKVDAFSTEAEYDVVVVNGIRYSGNQGPDGVVATGVISWSSDYSVERSGWKMCIGSQRTTSTTGMPSPTTPSSTTTTTTPAPTSTSTTFTTSSTTTLTTTMATITTTMVVATTTAASTTTTSTTTQATTAPTTSSVGLDFTTTTTGNPFGKHGWFVWRGSCSIDASGCALSPNYPSFYSPRERCTIVVEERLSGPITVNSFSTERNYDVLVVNGIRYSGNQGPDGVVPKGLIAWSSDYSVQRSGWKICMGPTSTTTTTKVPTTSTSVAVTTAITSIATTIANLHGQSFFQHELQKTHEMFSHS